MLHQIFVSVCAGIGLKLNSVVKIKIKVCINVYVCHLLTCKKYMFKHSVHNEINVKTSSEI